MAHSSVLQQGGAQEAHDAAWLIDDAHYAEAKAKVYNSKHDLPAEAVKGEGVSELFFIVKKSCEG